MDLTDQVCLVTGAARRIGRVIALALARRGARVVVHYHRSCAEAQATASECARLSGRTAVALEADLTDPADIERLVAEAGDLLGPVAVLVNNASSLRATPFLSLTPEKWDAMLDTNLRGPALFCRAVAPGMIARGGGVIVNIGDAATDPPEPRFVPYGVAKAGLVALTRGLALELAPSVRVNAILPDYVLPPDAPNEATRRRFREAAAQGRVATPERVAADCLYLIESDEDLTGVVMAVLPAAARPNDAPPK
jgi:NAD(P)-dependent dehydrogenase (short-subunit alcohol dehydrogenase family)